MGSDKSSLVPLACPAGGFITRMEFQLTGLLREIVGKKIFKLRKIQEPKLLVILDLYCFERSIGEWTTCLPPEAAFFGSVIRVQGSKADLIAGSLVDLSGALMELKPMHEPVRTPTDRVDVD
jgi:hypothetical protein